MNDRVVPKVKAEANLVETDSLISSRNKGKKSKIRNKRFLLLLLLTRVRRRESPRILKSPSASSMARRVLF